uniref:B10_CYTX binder n=1 Tax=synthetic construct TaxID=32630 RepID=UPI003624ACC7
MSGGTPEERLAQLEKEIQALYDAADEVVDEVEEKDGKMTVTRTLTIGDGTVTLVETLKIVDGAPVKDGEIEVICNPECEELGKRLKALAKEYEKAQEEVEKAKA